MDKKEFWDRYDHLDQEFVKNYDKLEHLFVQQLEDEGLDFFDLSQVHLLGKFESTLPALCALYEKNIQHLFDYDYVLVNLLFAYVHLRDQKNATRIRQILKDIGYAVMCERLKNAVKKEHLFRLLKKEIWMRDMREPLYWIPNVIYI